MNTRDEGQEKNLRVIIHFIHLFMLLRVLFLIYYKI
jgi:hypothetical protein